MKTLDRVKNITTPFVFGIAFLGLWEGAVNGFDLKPYFLAAPSKIMEQFLIIRLEFGKLPQSLAAMH